MTNKSYPQRKSPRLRDYNYQQAGMYFVTICTYRREHHFGDVIRGEMQFSTIGQMAYACWDIIPQHFATVELDAFVIMPNHIHGIVVLTTDVSSEFVGTRYASSAPKRPNGVRTKSLGAVVGSYKSAVSKLVHQTMGLTAPRLWQERYHDHIIRDEKSLNVLREYVLNNPSRWEADQFYSDTG